MIQKNSLKLKIVKLWAVCTFFLRKLLCINLKDEELNLNEKHFYDGIHTTPEGSIIIGEFLAEEFNEYFF